MSTQTGCLRLCYVFLQVLLSVLRALRSFFALWRHFINYDFISVHFCHSNLVILVNFTFPNLHTHTHTTKKQRNIRLWSNLLVVVVKMTMTSHLFVLLRVFVFNSQLRSPRSGKTGNKKKANFLPSLLQNQLNSDVARFTTHIKPVLQQIRLFTGLNAASKTRKNTIQLV